MSRLRVLICILTVWAMTSWAPAQPPNPAQPTQPLEQPLNLPPDYPAAPTDGIYLSDRAAVLTMDEVKTLNKAAADIKAATGVSVMVVTIRSVEFMSGSAKMGIEEYASGLVGHWNAAKTQGNRDVLLLWARDDERAWIQLGSAWTKAQGVSGRAITESVVMPMMKQGSYGQGLLAGVNAMGGLISREISNFPAPAGAPAPGATTPAAAAPSTPAPVPTATEEPLPQPPPQSNMLWLIPVGACVVLVVLVLIVRAFARRGGEQDLGNQNDYR